MIYGIYRKPDIIILAGPNGAGKSTLYKTRVKPHFDIPFINADEIQKNELCNPDENASYQAAEIANERRMEYFDAGKSFITETVFSHPSKLDLIKQAKAKDIGFCYFMSVSTNNPEISIKRVKIRVIKGGHDVPENKVRQRYDRNGTIIREAALLVISLGFMTTHSYIIYQNLCLN